MQKNYRIDLSNYKVQVRREQMLPVAKGGKGAGQEEDYDVRRVVSMIILHPNQAHKGFRFYSFIKISKKIKNAKEDFIILSGEEYNMVKSCFDNFSGFGPDDGEMVERIYEAKEEK